MKARCHIIVLLTMCLISCSKDPGGSSAGPLVVEGWIESGEFPVVMVTTPVVPSEEYQSIDDQAGHIVRWARVSVSDGDETILLTGMYNRYFFPPFIYTTNRMRGKEGKTYTLEVEYGGRVATAVTTIPSRVALDRIDVIPDEGGSGEYCLRCVFSDPPEEKNYYRLFVKAQGRDSTFVPSFLGVFDDENISRPASHEIMRGSSITNEDSWAWNPALFEAGRKVYIKFCTIDAESYRYWTSFEKVSALSILPMFSAAYNPQYNVEGAMGYWCGYGLSEYEIIPGE